MINDNDIKKRSVVLNGHATSITLENIFWRAFVSIAQAQGKNTSQLLTEIDENRNGNLSSAVRIYVLRNFMKQNHQLKSRRL